jgi:hypothetical protein
MNRRNAGQSALLASVADVSSSVTLTGTAARKWRITMLEALSLRCLCRQ